ncbi:conserved exported hypothetical protein [Magnetospirillum sp. LM-5]|uniref:hypothetical protein n=1 Tax=Magnetospirillum sp. LM-5 TaxID=2681466 RepID=UPI0013862671|nr:hypothetical protein [Magnetospirillum sp. LM-5]CAA7626034.1 conserved exported hypothetical protein [Magnetospirillum sp. LM-5]
MTRRPMVALPLLFLAACASQQSEPMVTKVAAMPPGGMWEVVGAAAVEPSPTPMASPYLGQKMMLALDAAGDPAGRLCKTPVFQGWDASPATVLGPTRGEATRSGAVRPVLEVMCDGQSFGSYVSQPDGSLMTRVNNWVLTLNRAAPPPAPPPVMLTPEPAPVAAPTPAPAPAPAPMLEKRTLVYLASYKTEGSAQAGWKVLAKASPILAGQKPSTQSVDLGKKGKWVRLYAMASDEDERAKLCKQLGKLVDECGARNRE